MSMNERVLASQKHEERLAAFWPRKVSKHITRVLVKTPMTANQATILWGIISVANSYTVFLALTGNWFAIPLIPLIYYFCVILDSVDGEIARYKNIVNPVAGKLLDGLCHRATEFSLLAAYIAAAYVKVDSPYVLLVGVALLTGDAMYIYVYERRLTMLRLQVGFKGHVKLSNATVYQRGTPWRGLTRQQQIRTVTGLFNYKSVYAVVALSFLPPMIFLAGLGAIAAYKHWKWVRLMQRALHEGVKLAPDGAKAASVTTAAESPATKPATL